MKLKYLANIRFPTEKAHGIQIMSMCEAFAANGLAVELAVANRAVSDRFVKIKEDPLWCIENF